MQSYWLWRVFGVCGRPRQVSLCSRGCVAGAKRRAAPLQNPIIYSGELCPSANICELDADPPRVHVRCHSDCLAFNVLLGIAFVARNPMLIPVRDVWCSAQTRKCLTRTIAVAAEAAVE